MDREAVSPIVISLSGAGEMSDELRRSGVPVRVLNMNRGLSGLFEFPRLVRLLKLLRPDLIQTWMYHADLIGGVANRLGPRVPLVWGIRNGTLDRSHSKPLTRVVRKLCAGLSARLPTAIVACAESAAGIHEALGYCSRKMHVIPNGVDTGVFRRRVEDRAAIRGELGIPDHVPVIGCVARFDRQKDHETFVRAASILRESVPDARYVLCGAGCDDTNTQLRAWIARHGLAGQTSLLGLRRDISPLMNALDVHSLSSSYGEAFPNVVAESMACEIPNVVTDVGDAAGMVGHYGIAVPRENPAALADGWRSLLELSPTERRNMGEGARRRIVDQFSLERAVNGYTSLYSAILKPRGVVQLDSFA